MKVRKSYLPETASRRTGENVMQYHPRFSQHIYVTLSIMKEIREIFYDEQLKIEAYGFYGLKQKFPNHFHDHYVIGCIESGMRKVTCRGEEFLIEPGDLLFFNYRENHACEQVGDYPLNCRFINIKRERMKEIAEEITGRNEYPEFVKPMIRKCSKAELLREVYRMVAERSQEFEKEELFYLLMEQLLSEYAVFEQKKVQVPDTERLNAVCSYMKEHYSENVSLEQLCKIAGVSRYSLIRYFTKYKKITPYQYLESIRVNRAKLYLEQGTEPAEAAAMTGFSDQSHFTNFFKRLFGLTPAHYQRIFTDKKGY